MSPKWEAACTRPSLGQMLAHWQGITQMLTIQLEAGLVGNSWCLSAALPLEKNLIYTSFFILQPNFH